MCNQSTNEIHSAAAKKFLKKQPSGKLIAAGRVQTFESRIPAAQDSNSANRRNSKLDKSPASEA
jgi:restriction endonuclease Mrr